MLFLWNLFSCGATVGMVLTFKFVFENVGLYCNSFLRAHARMIMKCLSSKQLSSMQEEMKDGEWTEGGESIEIGKWTGGET